MLFPSSNLSLSWFRISLILQWKLLGMWWCFWIRIKHWSNFFLFFPEELFTKQLYLIHPNIMLLWKESTNICFFTQVLLSSPSHVGLATPSSVSSSHVCHDSIFVPSSPVSNDSTSSISHVPLPVALRRS